MNNIEIYNYQRSYSLFNLNLDNKKIELECRNDLVIIGTRNTSKLKIPMTNYIDE
jgi:hypothetical protein